MVVGAIGVIVAHPVAVALKLALVIIRPRNMEVIIVAVIPLKIVIVNLVR